MCWTDMRPNGSVCNNKWVNVLSEWGSEGYEHGVMCKGGGVRSVSEGGVRSVSEGWNVRAMWSMRCYVSMNAVNRSVLHTLEGWLVGVRWSGSEVEWEWGFAHCTVLQGKENCYYHGKVEEHPDWSVVISTCFGIRYIRTTCSVVPMDCTCVDCNVPDMLTHTQHTCTHSCHMLACTPHTSTLTLPLSCHSVTRHCHHSS